MADLYSSFEEMVRHEVEGEDFLIERCFRSPEVLILAIHGGPIEKHTDLIAREISGADYSLYALVGKRRFGNKDHLHIRSERYSEPRVDEMLETAQAVVSIHGECNTADPYVMLGGRDEALRDGIGASLKRAGFVIQDPKDGVAGVDPDNICNRGAGGRGGVQLEISKSLRDDLADDPALLHKFVASVRHELAKRGSGRGA